MVKRVLRKFEKLNDFNQYIKCTYEYSAENISFVDPKMRLKNGTITADLHVKPTDCHRYWYFSQSLRMNRLYYKESDFEWNKEKEK